MAKNSNAILTEAEVVAIMADRRVQRKIAVDYGISRSLVSMIKIGLAWPHISGVVRCPA